MTLHEFALIVAEMRKYQRKFFRGDRSSATLDTCKRLERAVDNAIKTLADPQPSLFGESHE